MNHLQLSSVSDVRVLQSFSSGSFSGPRTSALSVDSDDDSDVEEDGDEEIVETPADSDQVLYANMSQSSDQSFTVKHMRVLDWPAGRSYPHDKKTLLTLYSQLIECQKDRSKDHFLIHCL